MKEQCGIFGIYAPGQAVAEATYFGLYALQHRGQESAGIAVSDGSDVHMYRDKGLVPEVFRDEEILPRLSGHLAIGHVRYSTAGTTDTVNTQPLLIKYRKGMLALAHNGLLTNGAALREALEERGGVFQTSVDAEIMANLIARMSGEGIEQAVARMMAAVRGSYGLVLLTQDKLIGARDPMGIRPLCLGRLADGYVIASESCAFDAVGAAFIRDIRPGEIVVIDGEGLRSIQTPVPLQSALCVFEFVYFARTDSIMDGVGVYAARHHAGRLLAVSHPVEADIVIGVPDSAIPAAIGYSEQSGIPYGEGLTKNRYVGRTFIQPEQAMRELGVRTKLNALTCNVRGKRVIMVDDSIVRGTTSRRIVDMLRMAGAREVHMRISSPPVVRPCYLGVDTPDTDQLVGATHTVEQIQKMIGADSLGYLSQADLLKTVEGSSCSFCHGCFSDQYPLPRTQAAGELRLDS